MEMEEFFKKLPPEIVLKILNYVYKDNDQTICETIPYLEQFINDPISKEKRKFKPKKNFSNFIFTSTRELRFNYIIYDSSINWITDVISNSFSDIILKKQERRKKIKSYNHSRRQEMKYRNKNQKHFMKR